MRRMTKHGKGLAIGFDFGEFGLDLGIADTGFVSHPVISDEMRVAVHSGSRALSGDGYIIDGGLEGDALRARRLDDGDGQRVFRMAVDRGGTGENHIL